MTQYVNKNSVEKILEELWQTDDGQKSEYRISYNKALQDVQIKLDTIEVKEVDLKKELKTIDDNLFDLDGVAVKGATSYLTVNDVKDIAQHFFELGINTRKI